MDKTNLSFDDVNLLCDEAMKKWKIEFNELFKESLIEYSSVFVSLIQKEIFNHEKQKMSYRSNFRADAFWWLSNDFFPQDLDKMKQQLKDSLFKYSIRSQSIESKNDFRGM